MQEPALRIHGRIDEVPREAWDALLDAESSPFVSWTYLDALEKSGCAAPRTGWWPRHLTLWRGDRLVAAAPTYARTDSDGDFSRDFHWASYAQHAGIRYYPKLLITVPFTPATGRRILVAAAEPRAPLVAMIVRAAQELAAEEQASSVHVLFPDAGEAAELEAAGLARRIDFQFHWFNEGFRDADAWLASLDAKRRHQARREQAAPAEQGITIRTIRGAEIRERHEHWAREVHAFYRSTVDKLMWGRPWLNQQFYAKIFADMPQHLEVVGAFRDERLVAGAFNVQGGARLYGRYWGCHEEHPFLHFNVCLYHSIRDCIERGIQVFEGGAGGQHKLSRGFGVAATHSAHTFLDPALDRAVREYLVVETMKRNEELTAWWAGRRS